MVNEVLRIDDNTLKDTVSLRTVIGSVVPVRAHDLKRVGSGRSMSIRWKILLLIGVAFALAMSAIRVVEQKIVYPSFVSLERDEATKDMNRCVEAIQNEIEHLLMFVGDWSAWDDTYEYVQDGNEKYRRDNLVETTYKNNKLNLLYICDLQGKVVYGEIYDYREMKKLDLAEFSRPSLGADHPLVRFDAAEDSESGILTTERGLMLIVAKPILKSDNTGAVRGSIIMGHSSYTCGSRLRPIPA